MFDATFWVAISFLLFIVLLVYKKVPQIILNQIDEKISQLKTKIDEAENLKSSSEKLLGDAKSKLEKSENENIDILAKAKQISESEIAASLEKMKQSLENKEKAARSKIDQAKDDAINQVKKIATQVALETLEKAITENLDGKKQEEVNLLKLKQSIEKLKNVN
ncbi:MAG: hypothetical protein VW911_00610 [Pelagibacteraceae bacterium]